jgi:hypothetical protein
MRTIASRLSTTRVAVIFYGIWLLLTRSALGAMWWYAARHPALLKDDVTAAEVAAVERLVTPAVLKGDQAAASAARVSPATAARSRISSR